MEKPSFDSVIALWNELKPEEQKALVDSDNRPGLKRFLAGTRAVVTATFKSLLDACHQDGYCNPDFTELLWPLEPIAADETDWEVVVHFLAKGGSFNECKWQLEKLAAKGEIRLLTGSRRVMEYIARHPAAQMKHPIILPLLVQHLSGDWCLPVFSGHWGDGRRDLGLCLNTRKFNSHDGWLVLKRKQK
ncbi:MAG: hypothetical protein AAB568_01905 [Patescibacteria group bacterium]